MGPGGTYESPMAVVGCGPSGFPKLEFLWLFWLAAGPFPGERNSCNGPQEF